MGRVTYVIQINTDMNKKQIENKIEMLEVALDGISARLESLEGRLIKPKTEISRSAFMQAFEKGFRRVQERKIKNGVSKV